MVKEIKCFGGQIVLVDDEDYPILSRHAWCLCGNKKRKYASTTLNSANGGIKVYMHHMIMGTANIDHRSADQFDNQKTNLRKATKSQNGGNARKMKTRMGKPTSSKYKGVHWSKTAGKWRAVIKCEGKMYYGGNFNKEEEAARAYNKLAKKLFGEYARVNKI